MSLNTKCSECGEWFPIGAKHSIGESCHRCKQKKAQFAAEISATYPKPKCPVFGCTIPRGIPHEHPAGVAHVMRDPAAPMSRHERAHIKALSDAIQHGTGFTLDGKYVPNSDVYAVADPAPMVPGRKLRDTLLEAGHNVEHFDMARDATLEAVKPRRTLAQSIGKFMAWMFGIPALLLAAFAIGHYFGWWV